MNLLYKILWFEDAIDWAEPLVRELKIFIEEMGFVFSKPRFERNNSHINTINYKEYDLILMDYNLSGTEKGDTLIKKIREHDFFSEIVFYSADGAPSLRKAVLDNELDGVYCADRQRDSFLPKVQEVIKVTVKKVLDLNNLRGIVMAETSNIDETMLEIIAQYSKTLKNNEKNDFLEKRRKKLLKSITSNAAKIRSEDIDKFYYNWLFDSNQKWLTILEIVKAEFPEKESITKLYSPDIIKKRNQLAHVKEIIDASGNTQLVGDSLVFNEQTSKELLNSIKKHEENINAILALLKTK